ncbi:hypothetical protein [Microbulbifer taiwanensis]|uniref:DUF4785 domain-containing protein n=1 Tax=Microbulbifer taiwanensis TaxID=986746 RepID=A0ABW1YQD1_9GAMM|nr:hypothetical protein [Microbulbifer taiwanensis]
MSRGERRRYWRPALLLVGVLLVAFGSWQLRGGGKDGAATAAAVEAPSIEPKASLSPTSTASVAAAAVPVETPRVWQQLQARPVKTELHQSLLSDLARHHRYPPENRAIKNPAQDPISQTHGTDRRTTRGEDGAALTLWTDRKFYLRGDAVHVYAYLARAGEGRVAADFRALLVYDDRRIVAELDLEDGDGDRIYEAELEAGVHGGESLPAGIYKVVVDTDIGGLRDAVAFTLSEDIGRYTGALRDFVTAGGNLLVEAEVEVSRAARYYFRASLYNNPDTPIGSTQYAAELAPGRHWVPLEFYGLMIRDRGQDGPYLVKQLSLARVAVPMARGGVLEADYYTGRYRLEQFTDAPYRALAGE